MTARPTIPEPCSPATEIESASSASPTAASPAARNAGVGASSGEYLAFLDDDDEWMPEHLARCVPVLDQDSNCVLVYTAAFKIDLAGRAMPNQESQTWGLDSPTPAQMFERPWNVPPSQFMVRRATFARCAGFDERLSNGQTEDIFFLLRAREYGYFRSVPEVLVRKTTRPHYPKALEREQGCELFVQAVRERYGAAAIDLIREFRRNRLKLMIHMAHVLTQEGRPKDARRCLARVIHYQPTSPKAYRRYLKTFLPARAPRQTSRTDEA